MGNTNFYITKKMIDKVNFVHLQEHAAINAISSLKSELFEQKYHRPMELIESWGKQDDDIERWAEEFYDWISKYLYVKELMIE